MWKTHLGLTTRFLLLSDSWRFADVGSSLWRENGSVVYNCCWSSPAQSFSSPSPAGLMTIFHCLTLETPSTWRARSPYLYSPRTRSPGYTPKHWVPFSSPPTTRRATVEVFEPTSKRDLVLKITPLPGPHRKHRSSFFARLFISAGTCLPRCCSETVVWASCCIFRALHKNGRCLQSHL
jgi:hypothetical protein